MGSTNSAPLEVNIGPTTLRSSEVDELSPELVGDSEFAMAVMDMSRHSSSPMDSLLTFPALEFVLEGRGAERGLPELLVSRIIALGSLSGS